MAAGNGYSYPQLGKSVIPDYKLNVPNHQVAHVPIASRRVTRDTIEDLATEKYRSYGKGGYVENTINITRLVSLCIL